VLGIVLDHRLTDHVPVVVRLAPFVWRICIRVSCLRDVLEDVNSIFGPISHHIIFLFSFHRLDVHGVPNSWLLTLTGRDDDHMRVCTGFERPTRCRKARKLRKLFSWLGHTTGYRSFHCSEHVVVEPGRYFLASDLQFLGLGVEPTILDVVGFVLSRKKVYPEMKPLSVICQVSV
jgi:hypothetical protein